jgi:hypothetical protein
MIHSNREFIFIGYSIRKRFVRPTRIHKPGTTIITVDSELSKPHPLLAKPGPEEIEGYYNRLRDIRYSFEIIRSMFENLSEQERTEYGIFGYAVEKKRIEEYHSQIYNPVTKVQSAPLKFAYAMQRSVLPLGTFVGYDIVDGNIEWTSGLLDCDINWKQAEKCGTLNGHHLFSDYPAAVCFRDKADELVQEHSPFSVWAVYAV